MTRRRDASGELNFPTRRGRQLSALQNAKIGSARAKQLLLVLDLEIGSNWPSIDRSWKQLADRAEMSQGTFFRAISDLKELGLILVESVPASHKKRYRIIRSAVDELAELSAAERPRKAGLDSQNEKVDSQNENEHDQTENEDYQIENPTIYHALEHVPPPPPTRADGWAAVVEELNSLGVSQAVKAVDRAKIRKATLADVRAIIKFYRQVHETSGYGPGALQRRVADAMPGIDPQSGWPEPKRKRPTSEPLNLTPAAQEFKAQIAAGRPLQRAPPSPDATPQATPSLQQLEDKYGDELDALSDIELQPLLRRIPTVARQLIAKSADDPRQIKQVRIALLHLLSRDRSQMVIP